MHVPRAKIDWFERGVAVTYATIVVLGVAVVAVTMSLHVVGMDHGSVPLP